MTLRCDLIIRDVTVFDGTGAARFTGDVGVSGDRITGVGDLGGASADREIVATGKALAPGFIDAHTHDDRAVLHGPACMTCKMSQGVTTAIVGNCGISLSPVRMTRRPPPPLDLLGDESHWEFDSFADYADRLARDPSPVNTVALIGHMSLRIEAMGGDTQRAATDQEAEHMRRRLAESLAEAATGFSTGAVHLKSGAALRTKGFQIIPDGERLILQLPGGGGMGDPAIRDPQTVARDVRDGLYRRRARARPTRWRAMPTACWMRRRPRDSAGSG